MQLLFINRLSTLITLFFLSLFITSNAQPNPIKWGKIPAKDLAMTTYETDPDASAVVLCDYERVSVELIGAYPVSYEIHTRIKILKKEGDKYANITIPYLASERISNFKAQTINPEGITKLKTKEIFDEEVTNGYMRYRFTFPNVQVGSIIEYRYTLQSTNMGLLDTWYFQRDIPTRWSECRFMIPEYIKYLMLTNTDRAFALKEEKGTNIGPFIGDMYRWAMEDVPALKKEEHITTMRDYYNKIQLQTSAINVPGYFVQKFYEDWPHLSQNWWKRESRQPN